jgi:coenzyme F420-reducing hydrogenase beta subunit
VKKIGQIKETPVPHSECTGCGACYNICPSGAISFNQNEEGFWAPYIDAEKCILCYKCDAACPIRTPQKNENEKDPECRAVAASDAIRLQCSSGGVFGLLAEDYLQNGGYVCGAKFDENFDLKTVIISDLKDLPPLLRSKYVQSDTGKVFSQIKELLLNRKQVLFCGCPCQVAGLKQFLRKDYKNLFLIDIVCHGVPSPKAFKDYLNSIYNAENVEKIDFRDKTLSGWRCTMNVFMKDGQIIRNNDSDDIYYKSFLNQLTLNQACTKCKFATIPRQGDITLGDFWGIEKNDSALSDKKGTSLLLINNRKGRNHIGKFFNQFIINKVTPINWATRLNKSLAQPYPEHFARKRFFDNIGKIPFDKNVNDCMNNMFDIGVVSIYTVGNFGGALTYFGLYNAVKELGYSVLMIERPANAPHKPAPIEKIYYKSPYQDYECAKIYPTKNAMRELNKYCRKFLVGSDQMFNIFLYYNFGKWCTLDWVDDNKIKIAYAASFGHDTFTGNEDDRSTMSYFMKKFDRFSVRESTGVDVAKKFFGIKADWVLDPVFLCEPNKYIELAGNSDKQKIADRYISSYILDPFPYKLKVLSDCSQKLGMPVEMFSEMHQLTCETPENVYYAKGKIEDRMKSLVESDFIITDSFHGVCFSLILQKNFICILNNRRGAARMRSILKLVGLENRIIDSYESFANNKNIWEKIDYAEVNKKLSAEIKRCTKWLSDALADKTPKSKSDYDLLVSHSTKLEKKIDELTKQITKLKLIVLQSKLPIIKDIQEYITELINYKRRYCVIISVKDTPGHFLNDKIAETLLELGIRTHLKDKHWHSFISILDRGKNIFEVMGDNEEPSFFEGKTSDIFLFVSSKAYRNGNLAEIKIEGKDYSVNERGLNIVVYDPEKKLVVDSVCFDTHVPAATCFRKPDLLLD